MSLRRPFIYLGLLVGLFFAPSANLAAQLQHAIFPAETGQQLLTSLVGAYKPATVLNYTQARDTLFSKVFLEKDSVVCIYTNHKVYLPPGQDPTQAVYLNGTANGINTEHSYPQSKGAMEANGNPYSDMHHLYPSRYAANEARADHPFKDIADSNTDKWFYRDQTLTNAPPIATRDLYSEWEQGAFEVRESQKGNIARSIFYFFTMYRDEALAADPLFFEAQRTTLCAWHDQDDIDSLEYARTFIIAKYQDNKPNPFVLDCSLAARSYCQGMNLNCPTIPLSASEEPEIKPILMQISPNPASDGWFGVTAYLPKAQNIEITLASTDGQVNERLFAGRASEGTWQNRFHFATAGAYIVSIRGDLGFEATAKLIVP